ncbi:hypothetical protein DENIS_1323 [Desulfonema ishimotonii]|uniref:Uncharacterized protein n=1 Tax=Desulfonema ishimotonii TaxID=45657 RepID=A0A401FTS0_9BACT|nr:hypothetical protein [Desulfonema ishimotonii]GBC60372.1 hypothetical protein DENIS_1323 [Desulfonema ishimotonii]
MHLSGVLRMVAVMVAAIMIGNWFTSEVRKARIRQEPWYKPYLSPPGLLILIGLMTPIVIWAIRS